VGRGQLAPPHRHTVLVLLRCAVLS